MKQGYQPVGMKKEEFLALLAELCKSRSYIYIEIAVARWKKGGFFS
jgi:hypothetical protein